MPIDHSTRQNGRAYLRKIYFTNIQRDAAKIGFDEAMLYREVAGTISRRKINMKQLLNREVLAVFVEWKSKPDKIWY